MCDTQAFDGVALSPGLLNAMERKAGQRVVQCRWRYGDAPRRSPFPPHRSLAGVFTTLAGDVKGGFGGFGRWFPGDHKGCLCSLVPVFAKTPGGPVLLENQAMVPIWDPDTGKFLRLEQRQIEYVGFEGVAPDVQAAIKRGINAYEPEFRPPRVVIFDTIPSNAGASGLADTFGIAVGKGEVQLSQGLIREGAARAEFTVRHEVGHWKQSILELQSQQKGGGFRYPVNIEARFDEVIDDLIPTYEVAEQMGLSYPWLGRDLLKRGIPGAPGNWAREMYAELQAHMSLGHPLPRELVEIMKEFNDAIPQ